MADSGHINVAVTKWDTLKFSWSLSSQSIANNTSTVAWKLELITTEYGRINSTLTKDWSVTVNRKTYSGTNKIGIGNNQTKTLASGTTIIEHAADGKKTFSFSFTQEIDVTFSSSYIGTLSGSGTGELPTIARASQPSLVTWPESTQNVGAFGETFSIHMNRAEGTNFTHTVRYEYGTRTDTIATGVATGTTWAVPLTFMNDIPSATSASGRIYVDTYNGSTLIGTKYTGFTVTVPASVKPTCTLTLDDTTGVDDIYGSPVKGLSKIKVTVKAGLAYSSPIKAYSINANGSSYTGSEITTEVLQTAGTSRVAVTVTDARGRTGTNYYDMTVQDYNGPTISQLTVRRCNADGTENEEGDYSKVVISAAVTSLNKKNTATYTLRYKKTTATTWTSVTLTALNNTYAVTDYAYVFAADGSSSYDVELTAADRHDSTIRTTSLSTAFTLMNWGANGTSMAVGKVAEKSRSFEVALDNYFYGHTQQEGNRYAFSSPGVAGTGGFVLMAKVQVIAANADTPITFVFSRRQATTPMTVHLRLSNATATTSSLASIRYEGENYGAFAYAFDALTWYIYVQKGSNYDTITLQDWYTSQTMNSRVKVTFPGELVSAVPAPYYRATPAVLDSILDAFMPVGFVLTLYSQADPNTMYPGTTWTRITNAFLWATDANGIIGQTGGEAEHTLTENEMPSHTHKPTTAASPDANYPYTFQLVTDLNSTHTIRTKVNLGSQYIVNAAEVATGGVNNDVTAVTATAPTGGGKAHNNMPPYVQVSIWRRTA